MNVHIVLFSTHATAGPLLSERRRLARPPFLEEVREDWADTTPRIWRLVEGTEEPFGQALTVWTDGELTTLGLRLRMKMAWHSLTGNTHAPAIVSVTPAIEWAHKSFGQTAVARQDLLVFLRDHPEVAEQMRHITAVGRR